MLLFAACHCPVTFNDCKSMQAVTKVVEPSESKSSSCESPNQSPAVPRAAETPSSTVKDLEKQIPEAEVNACIPEVEKPLELAKVCSASDEIAHGLLDTVEVVLTASEDSAMLPTGSLACSSKRRQSHVRFEAAMRFMVSVEVTPAASDDCSMVASEETPASSSRLISNHLKEAKRQGRMRKLRLRAPTLTLGLGLCFGGVYMILSTLGEHNALSLAGTLCCGTSIVITLSSILRSDRRCIPLAVAFAGIPSLIGVSVTFGASAVLYFKAKECRAAFPDMPCWFNMMKLGGWAIISMVSLINAIWLALGLYSHLKCTIMHQRLWKGFSVGCLSFLLISLPNIMSAFVSHEEDILYWVALSVVFTALGMIGYYQPLVCLVQSWLMSRGEAAAASAGVSQLLGGQTAEKVFDAARRTFTYVTADKLESDDMADNKPNPRLSGLTTAGHLGEADAFFSHSWHDDPALKWAAMQKWREAFKQKNNGREPKLWIDKYSIDQGNIENSLACLPVYLAGCKKLLIICGSTYLKRLWCLVEIFVFLEMGGKMSDVEVILIEDQSESSLPSHWKASPSSMEGVPVAHHASSGLADQIAKFDPREARCFSDYDTDRLHSVIGAAGYDQIEELIKNVFARAPRHVSM